MKAINWNNNDNETPKIYWNQNINQFWVPEKFKPSRDLATWDTLTKDEKTTYVQALSGLTGLDREQGDNGMPLISIHHDNMFEQAIFAWMGMMEHIHSKSYSYIFSSLISQERSEYYLTDWVNNQPELQQKYKEISHFYYKLYNKKDKITKFDRYMAMVASVFLESFAFYSGFFYPFFLSGQGKMVACGEIIHKITADEAIHGSFTGIVAQRLFKELANDEQNKAKKLMYELLDRLIIIENSYTEKLYTKVGLVKDVKDYLSYNANRALQNLGYDNKYDHDPVTQIVLNGIDTSVINHDFFSSVGDYAVPLNIEPLTDDDFNFDDQKDK